MKIKHFKAYVCALFLPLACMAEQEPFVSLQDNQIECFCHQEDERVGRQAIDLVLDALPSIRDEFGLVQRQKITLVISTSDREFVHLTQNQIPDWGVGAADPIRSVIYMKSPRIAKTDDAFSTILLHELSHVLLGQHVGEFRVSRWFDEGLAMLVANEGRWWDVWRVARASQTHHLVPLHQIDDVLRFRKSKAALAYQESKLAVDMLSREYGPSIYQTIIRNMDRTLSWEDAFELSLGISVDVFEDSFFEKMEYRYRWYFLFDFPVYFSLVIVVLFIAAYVAKRRQSQRQLSIWEADSEHE